MTNITEALRMLERQEQQILKHIEINNKRLDAFEDKINEIVKEINKLEANKNA
jgi:hypothetical protein